MCKCKEGTNKDADKGPPPPQEKKIVPTCPGLDCAGDFPLLRLIIRQGCCWCLGTDEDLAVSGEHLGGGEEVAGPE